jgi:7,8-dihydroneopterin aldolase/epimerase/oxygenase
MRDRLFVHGLQFLGKHGVFDEERRDGRNFRVDVEADLETVQRGEGDALARTVDYREIADVVLEVAHGPSRHLIETLADEMATRLLTRLPLASVQLTLRKYADGVPGDPEWVAIRVHRSREGAAG